MLYTPRAHWGSAGAGGHPMGPVGELIVHHFWRPDVSPDATGASEREVMRSVERYHITQFYDGDAAAGGGTGYQFVVFPSGRAYEGRGWGRTGAHTVGRNSASVGVAFAFDGDAHDPSDLMWDVAAAIAAEGVNGGHLTEGFTVAGHRDYAPKTCPGDRVYPHIGRLVTAAEEVDVALSDEDIARIAGRLWDHRLAGGSSAGNRLVAIDQRTAKLLSVQAVEKTAEEVGCDPDDLLDALHRRLAE